MALTLRGTFKRQGTAPSLTIGPFAAAQVGDVVWLSLAQQASGATLSPPPIPGWTRIESPTFIYGFPDSWYWSLYRIRITSVGEAWSFGGMPSSWNWTAWCVGGVGDPSEVFVYDNLGGASVVSSGNFHIEVGPPGGPLLPIPADGCFVARVAMSIPPIGVNVAAVPAIGLAQTSDGNGLGSWDFRQYLFIDGGTTTPTPYAGGVTAPTTNIPWAAPPTPPWTLNNRVMSIIIIPGAVPPVEPPVEPPYVPPPAGSVYDPQTPTWDIVLLTPTAGGRQWAMTHWVNVNIASTFDGVTADVTIPAADPAMAYLVPLTSDLLLIRNREFIGRLRIIDATDAMSVDDHVVTITAVDYGQLLKRRVLFKDREIEDQDQFDAAWDLVAYTQAHEDLGITRGTTDPSGVLRDRVLQRGQSIADAINEMARNDHGFDWWVDENLVMWMQYPRRRRLLNIEWKWGVQVREVGRTSAAAEYASVVLMMGATSETEIGGKTYPAPTPQIMAAESRPYGRWERTYSYPDVVTVPALQSKGRYHLKDITAMRALYALTLEPGVWSPTTPRLGDIFTLRIDSPPRLNIQSVVRIEELRVALTVDSEVVTMSVRAETAEDVIPSGPPEPIVFTDAFERATLGTDWVQPSALPYGTANQATRITAGLNFGITTGAVIGPQVTTLVPGCAEVLTEPFDTLSAWDPTYRFAASIVGGRTGPAARLDAAGYLFFVVPPVSATPFLTVGCAYQTANLAVSQYVLGLRSNDGANVASGAQHVSVVVTTAGAIEVRRGTSTGTVLGTSPAGLITPGTWRYIEVQCRLHDTLGSVILRVDGVVHINVSNVDTKNAGTATVLDTVILSAAGTGGTINLYDDLYVRTGSTCTFKGDTHIPSPPPVENSTAAAINLWTGAVEGDQYIEATVTFPGTGTISNDEAVICFYLCLDDSDFTGVAAQLLQNTTGFRLRWFLYDGGDAVGTSYDYFHEFVGSNHTTTIRFEATAAGVVRALIGGVVVEDTPGTGIYDFETPLTGTRMGMSARYAPGSGGGAAPPRIETVTFGGSGTPTVMAMGGGVITPFIPPEDEVDVDMDSVEHGAGLTLSRLNPAEHLARIIAGLNTRTERLERSTSTGGGGGTSGGGGGGTDEVWIGNDAPTGTTIELWYDPDAALPPEPPILVVKATPPTAADFGVPAIPVDSVWVQKP